jgi:hypothetical protein
MNTRNAFIAAMLISVAFVAGCDESSKVSQPFNDAPVERVDDGEATIVSMPDGFNNLAFKCVGNTLFATTYHGDSPYGSVTVIDSSSLCK